MPLLITTRITHTTVRFVYHTDLRLVHFALFARYVAGPSPRTPHFVRCHVLFVAIRCVLDYVITLIPTLPFYHYRSYRYVIPLHFARTFVLHDWIHAPRSTPIGALRYLRYTFYTTTLPFYTFTRFSFILHYTTVDACHRIFAGSHVHVTLHVTLHTFLYVILRFTLIFDYYD